MTYPLEHKIIKRFPYISADKTDIRATFSKARRDAENQNKSVLDADFISAGTAQRAKPDTSSW